MPIRKPAKNGRQLPESDNQGPSETASIPTTTRTRFIKLSALVAEIGMSKSSVYAAIKKGEFPAPVKTGKRGSAWVVSEVDSWQKSRMEARNHGAELAKIDDGKPRNCKDESR